MSKMDEVIFGLSLVYEYTANLNVEDFITANYVKHEVLNWGN